MSRSRNRAPDESSLETLLDTVCNTLGVVVFIAILLVLQINAARPNAKTAPASQDAVDKLKEQQQQIEKSRHRIEQLQAAAVQQKLIAGKFANTESHRLVSRLRRQTADHLAKVQQKQTSMSSVASAQQAAILLATQLSKQKQSLDELRKQAPSIESTLKTEIEQRSTSTLFPEGKVTQREMIGILLKEGVMYRVHLAVPFKTINSKEVRKLKEGADEFIEPISGSGLRINAQSPDLAEIARHLDGYSKADHVLRIFFWPDSFAEFQVLRDVIVRESYHYAPDPVPDKQRIQTAGQVGAVFEQ
jgi:hypothetical protein